MGRIKERALLVGLALDGRAGGDSLSLDELQALTEQAGGEVVGRYLQRRPTPHPATYVGKGKVTEIQEGMAALAPDVVIFDSELTPGQVRNLEKAFACRVVDRSEVILDIFALRARTYQSKLAVELAQLEYQLPRLRHMWSHLGRLEGAPGIGTRGPGEKQLETDRRLARKQIQFNREKLQAIETRIDRDVQSRSGEYAVALVGYTNTGKSTLMRHFSSRDVVVEDQLFATIDTRTARVDLGNHEIILLSDTVGFINNIPHHLIESFKATLLHARRAGLLLHVIDASSPLAEQRIGVVDKILKEIGCGDIATVFVFNKIDLAPDRVTVAALAARYRQAVVVSAATGENMVALGDMIRAVLRKWRHRVEVEIPIADGRLIALVNKMAEVHEQNWTDTAVRMSVTVSPDFLARLETQGLIVGRKKAGKGKKR
ncbi:MAG: GTPase HflX [Planctomycetota bacterium]